MSLGSKLKELRIKKGVSLQAVADAVGASKPHIWELERGTSRNPSLELVTKLSKYFEVSVDHLAGITEDDSDSRIQAFARELTAKNFSESDIQFLRDAADLIAKKPHD